MPIAVKGVRRLARRKRAIEHYVREDALEVSIVTVCEVLENAMRECAFCRVSWAASEGNTRGFELIKYVSQNCVMKCPDVIAIGPCHRSVSVAKCISHLPGPVGVV